MALLNYIFAFQSLNNRLHSHIGKILFSHKSLLEFDLMDDLDLLFATFSLDDVGR